MTTENDQVLDDQIDADATDVDAGDADATDVDAGDADATDVDAGDADATDVDAGDADTGDAQPKTRKANRVQELARQRTEERDKRIRLEAELEVLKRQPAQSTSQHDQEDARREAEKLALMEPSEKQIYLHGKKMEQMQQELLLTRLQMADSADRSDYLAKASANPVYARHSEEVERRLGEFRRNGVNPTRKQVLAVIIGEQALDAKPKPQAKQQAAARVAATQSKAPSAKEATPGKSSLGDLEKRLASQKF